MKKALITGLSGFIGGHLSRAISSSYQIVNVVRTPTRGCQTQFVYPSEVSNSEEVVCFHLASCGTNPPYPSFEQCLQSNVDAPLQFFNQAIETGLSHFVILGTGLEYGETLARYERVPTWAELRPTNAYSHSKAIFFDKCVDLAQSANIRVDYIRLFYTFGPGEAMTRLVPYLLRMKQTPETPIMLTDCQQVRDVNNVQRACAVIKKIASSRELSNGINVFNVGSGVATSLKFFVEKFCSFYAIENDLCFGIRESRPNQTPYFTPLLDDSFSKRFKASSIEQILLESKLG